jgi:two-component system response regulator CpxR
MKNRILIIDDDMELCELLHDYLAAEGFQVDAVHEGEEGAKRALTGEYGMVVLDVMLPGLNGFEVLRRIRGVSSTPVLMLTARGEDIDRIIGLEMGADDYLPKPFNPRELVARLRAIRRRVQPASEPAATQSGILAVGDVMIDAGSRTVQRGDEQIAVTSVEFSVLEALLRVAGTVISRDELSLQALGRPLNSNDRSIDVHVSSLRKKLGPLGQNCERIKSVRGVGYLYTRPAAECPLQP